MPETNSDCKRLLVYPQWSLYPQIFPLELERKETSRPVRELVASQLSLPAEFLDVFDAEPLEDRAATPVSDLPDDARLGVSFGRSEDGSPFPRSRALFQIGQGGPVKSHRSQPSARPPAKGATSVLRQGVLLSAEEERLRRSLLTRGFSDDLDRLGEIDVTSLLPHRRPGDAQAGVVFRLCAHLDENNRSDLELLSKWLEKTRDQAGEDRIRIPYRIELELDLLVDYRKTRLARWLELAIPTGERLLGMDRGLERPGFLGGNLDRAAVYVYLEHPDSESSDPRASRAQCVETIARVGSLLSAYPKMADAQRRTLSSFVTDHSEPLHRKGPLDETCAFTWRSVCFLPDPGKQLECLARKELSSRLLDLYDSQQPGIDGRGERAAQALLGSVGLLPPRKDSGEVSFLFNPMSFHSKLLARLLVQVGPRGMGQIEALPFGVFRREVLPALRSWLNGPQVANSAVEIGTPETRAHSLEWAVLAQVSAFRSAIYELYDGLVEQGNPRLARSTLLAVDRLLGLSAEPTEKPEEPEEAQTVPEYLAQVASSGVEDSVDLAQARELCAGLGRRGLWSFLKELLRRDRKDRVHRLLRLVGEKVAGEESRQAAVAIRQSITFGSPFSLAWHLSRRAEVDCAAQRRSLELLAHEAERDWTLSQQGLEESEKDRLKAQAKVVGRILHAEHGGLDLDRRLRSWLEELVSRGVGVERTAAVLAMHEVLSERSTEFLAEVPPALLERRKVDPVSELAAFEDRVLSSPAFNLGYLREHIDPSAEAEHRSLTVFVPETLDPKVSTALEGHLSEVAYQFQAGAAVVAIPGLEESLAILDWTGCPVTAFSPREVSEGLLSAPPEPVPAAFEETGT